MHKHVIVLGLALALGGAACGDQPMPPWSDGSAPRGLKMTLEKLPGAGIAGRAGVAQHRIARAGEMVIDGRFEDWGRAEWIIMRGEPYHFGDNVWTTVTLEIPEGAATADDLSYLGFEFDQMDVNYQRKYLLDEFYVWSGVVVTEVRPDTPAAQAGLREGDVIFETNGRKTAWGYDLWRELTRLSGEADLTTISFRVRRSGRDRIGGDDDLSARIAFLVDDESLYFAAQVSDDVQAQTKQGYELWMNDSIQIGFDPVLDRQRFNYSEDGQEVGFALTQDGPVAWRWKTRRTVPQGRMENLELAVERRGSETFYEAAIPLVELAPLSPDMWPHCGIDVVINDSDDGVGRRGRLELVPLAMTEGKRPRRFQEFEFEPSPDESKVSAALFWDWDGSPHPNGRVGLTVATRSPQPNRLTLTARLTSEADREATPADATVEIPVTTEPQEWFLLSSTRSRTGRYRIDVTVRDEQGQVVAAEGIPFYIAPGS